MANEHETDTHRSAAATGRRPDPDRRLSVAPMMDWTDRHYRYLMRLITGRTLLYTEMVPAQALWHGRAGRFLHFDACEHPVALQVGGADPEQLAHAAALAERWGYDQVDLNCGCPSDRVQSGRFGACLMAEPALVAEMVAAMRAATRLPVTVKTRIGIDHQDSEAFLARFVETVAGAGCTSFTIHARKAWLNGLSPKENRNIPPLDYDRVERLRAAFPGLEVVLNGGVMDLDEAEALLARFDGVMIGRAAYQTPFVLAEADRRVFGATTPVPDRVAVAEAYMDYVAREIAAGERLSRMTRHLVGLFQGLPGARAWRRHLSEHGPRRDADAAVIADALEHVAGAAA
ncbi:tRNA-dihydrouridine(20/20a) synthase [wastewater metagenome]|uniref:tRNA-dihydrouridine(20/20a) synthase n=2 Tax=unclassified sequences TaxID=12908 RepID=A0A5B8R9D4_9ZZZZ|nr:MULTISPECIES: tRNA dihydrouridine(20/20a) synthase DusA [Arhodomonas]QEA05386.1 tRNA-dihydrouridine(20/20a) synthase [uncultured organism]